MRVKVIESIDDYYWGDVWKIYKNSVPIYKQRSLEMQKEAMKNRDFKCLAAIFRKRVIGIIFYWDLDNIRYVEHLAWDKELKCSGYESRILSKLCEDNRPTIIELEKVANDEAISRIISYEELGFKKNIYLHKHPAYKSISEDINSVVLSYPNKLTFEDYLYFDNILVNEVMLYKDN